MADTLAIHGGQPVRERPFSQWPIFGDQERHALISALDSGQWGKTTGDVTVEFEKRFAEYHEAQHYGASGTYTYEIILYPDGTIQHAGVSMPPFHIYSGQPADIPPANKPRDLQVVTAACKTISSR